VAAIMAISLLLGAFVASTSSATRASPDSYPEEPSISPFTVVDAWDLIFTGSNNRSPNIRAYVFVNPSRNASIRAAVVFVVISPQHHIVGICYLENNKPLLYVIRGTHWYRQPLSEAAENYWRVLMYKAIFLWEERHGRAVQLH